MIALILQGRNGQFCPLDAEPIVSEAGYAQIIGMGEPRHCSRHLSAGEHCLRASVVIRPAFVDKCADVLSAKDVNLLHSLMSPGFRSIRLPRCDVMLQLSRALVETPYGGSLGSLFHETTITQLMFQTLRLAREDEKRKEALGNRCHDAALHAQAIIDASLNSPPGTLELARRVGVNRNLLQASFKAIFGMTVFAYVREQRLKMARIMIEEHRLGAAEAGYKVGFASPSAFSAAYRRKFGHPPIMRTRH